jgi:Tol biopolymer transport system component
MGRRFTTGWETTGTLARASLGGGAPRPIVENVHDADWGPDGESIAVVREVAGRFRLEYPMGTVLYETEGWIGEVRVSPQGDRIAFVEHPVRGDNVGNIVVVGVDGSAQSFEVSGGWGVVWAPEGDVLWAAWGGGISRVELDGDVRLQWRGFGNIRLLDVAPDGRLLVAPSAVRREMMVRSPATDTERNLTWFNWSTPRALSSDGRTVVFDEGNLNDAEGYWLYVRGTDGSPPVRLDNGLGIAISPEGRWVFALSHPFSEPQAVLMPVGAGERQPLDLGGIRPQPLGYWTPDGRSLVVAGADDSGASRLYLKDLTGGEIRPVTPAGIRFSYDARAISPDGLWVVVTGPEGRLIRYPLTGGEGIPVPGAESGDVAAAWAASGDGLFVYRSGSLPTRVDQLDLTSGERQAWLQLSPADPAGVFNVDKLLITADGESYVYSYRRLLSELVLVDGLL